MYYIIYEESVVDKFKSNLLLVIFWLNIIDYNSWLIKYSVDAYA